MTAKKQYKHLIAAVLLALYAFVATPVQLWHHHKNIAGGKLVAVSANTKQGEFSKSSGSQSEANCPLCSHKYSTYNDDELLPIESSLILTRSKNGFYHLPVIAAPSFSLANKGPPSLS